MARNRLTPDARPRRRALGSVVTFALLSCGWIVGTAAAEPGDPALPGHHPLTQAQAGEVLIAELRCAACHSDAPPTPVPEKTAPDLSAVGARVSADYLRRFLASPAAAHPGTTMPDVLASKSAADRDRIAAALTHFLVAQTPAVPPAELTEPGDPQHGRELFHSVGCVACHGPREATPQATNRPDEFDEVDDPVAAARRRVQPTAVPLGHVAAKYSLQALGEFLFQPLRVRSSGRMPDMKLTAGEAVDIARYLVGEPPQPRPPFVPQPALVAQGKRHFQELNCAACHALPGLAAAPLRGSLRTVDLSRGCLSKASDRSPRFHLDNVQVQAIQASLRTGPKTAADPDADQLAVAKALTVFRCIACHVRDDYGGVHDVHNAFFTGSELKLGDDGRIPPPLTLVGAKLRPDWMNKVLFDGESVRHYMATRMPLYGTANVQSLPALFGRLDVLEGPEMQLPSRENRAESEREREKLIRAAGRELLGDKGANCVACHAFNGKAAQVNQGIDLLTSFERLQPGYFHHYLRDPGAFRPRTVMPTAWPNGQASFRTILDGDTDRQIEAIWYYLSLGTSAADPPGVRAVNTLLEVADHAQVHRGRSRVAGFRGIAVGLPERIHYAFNAETGTLSAIWQGDFVHVNWSGQGSGDFTPAGDAVALAQDVSFLPLAEEVDAWPRLPVMTKAARSNPDPLYPKNVGYQFRGYWLDESSVPTFQYRSGDVAIEERSVADRDAGHVRLRRVMQLDSPRRHGLGMTFNRS
jgi:mono/diheme cytochrome c family protein